MGGKSRATTPNGPPHETCGCGWHRGSSFVRCCNHAHWSHHRLRPRTDHWHICVSSAVQPFCPKHITGTFACFFETASLYCCRTVVSDVYDLTPLMVSCHFLVTSMITLGDLNFLFDSSSANLAFS